VHLLEERTPLEIGKGFGVDGPYLIENVIPPDKMGGNIQPMLIDKGKRFKGEPIEIPILRQTLP